MIPLLYVGLLLLALPIFPSGTNVQETEKAELVVQKGHSAPVTSVAVSPNGKIVASGGLDNSVKIWDAETGHQIRSLEGHSQFISSVAFSPDGKTVASGSFDSTVKLWSADTGELLKTLAGEKQWVRAIAFSPDGVTLAVGRDHARIELWNTATGNRRSNIWQHRLAVTALAFSRDGSMLASGSTDRTLRIWDPEKAVQRREIPGQTAEITSVGFFPDGRTLASAGTDGSIKTWNAETGEPVITFDKLASPLRRISISADGKTLASCSRGESIIRLWDPLTGKLKREFDGKGQHVNDVVFFPIGHTLAAANADFAVRIWDVDNGSHLQSLVGHSPWVNSVAVSPDGRTVASANADGTVRLWSLASGRILHVLEHNPENKYGSGITVLDFSPDGKLLAGGNEDRSIKIWNVETGELFTSLIGHSGLVSAIAFAPDGTHIASGSWDKTARVWDLETRRQTRVIDGRERRLFDGKILAGVFSIDFSPDGKKLAIGSGSNDVTLWDPETGELLKTFEGHLGEVIAVEFSVGGATLASSSVDRTVKIWDVATGTQKRSIALGGANLAASLAFAPDGKTLAGGAQDGTIKLWDEKNEEPIRNLSRHSSIVRSIVFSPDGKHLLSAGGSDATLKLWSVDSNAASATMTAIDKNDWVVTTSDGLFDASPNARKLMHYVIGLESVSLDQMKDAYFVPGLLRKIHQSDPLPKVQLFSRSDLYPDVEFAEPKPGQTQLPIKISNRGGGIGQVQVLVNGKEIVADARPAGFDPQTKVVTLTVALGNAPLVAGEVNRIEVIARNRAGSLSNKGTPRSAETFSAPIQQQKKPTPNIYVIAGGISTYTGENLNLNFAAKDAEDFAKAVEIGAKRLLKSDQSKVHVRLLTSNGTKSSVRFEVPDAIISTATKAEFQRAFADFKGATSNDVFIVYLAGHGISVNINQDPNQPGGNTYLYLTQEATTADRNVLSVADMRAATTISGDEIKEMMKQNNALKQVLILDTCAAGAVSGSFVAKRDVPSDQIGALERLKDNTGFYILMGSAADRVSYETSQYAQGLLTFSLLQGMKGAMLREDQYADVEMLFGYAKNTVGRLAKNIGGVQSPETITPDVSRSFDIGQFTASEKSRIALAGPIPLVLRPRLINPRLRFDNLGLERIFRAELRQASIVAERGDRAKVVFVESDEMPDALVPSGDYTVDGDSLTISLVLVRNDRQFGKEIVVRGKVAEKETLIRQLIGLIAAANER